MGIRRKYRVTPRRVVGVLAVTLALFFAVAFATKALDAYRLRAWRDRLQVEIVEMERERAALQDELRRRQTMAWLDECLREAGLVPEGVVSVVAVPVEAGEGATVAATDTGPGPAEPKRTAPFDNPHWDAWRGLIWGLDR